jgi:hypothetical protein
MRRSSAAGGGGEDSGLSKADRRALRKIAVRGHHGATAKEIMPTNESTGLAIAANLVRIGLAVATPGNRFVLQRYALTIRPSTFIADDDGHAVRVEHSSRAPLPRRPTSKAAPVDIAGLKITTSATMFGWHSTAQR